MRKNKQSIHILRGSNAKIAATPATETLDAGQLLYNKDKKYLTVGASNGSALTQAPVEVRRLHGYGSDDSAISNTQTNEFVIEHTATGLEVSAADKVTVKSGTAKLVANSSGAVSMEVGNSSVGIDNNGTSIEDSNGVTIDCAGTKTVVSGSQVTDHIESVIHVVEEFGDYASPVTSLGDMGWIVGARVENNGNPTGWKITKEDTTPATGKLAAYNVKTLDLKASDEVNIDATAVGGRVNLNGGKTYVDSSNVHLSGKLASLSSRLNNAEGSINTLQSKKQYVHNIFISSRPNASGQFYRVACQVIDTNSNDFTDTSFCSWMNVHTVHLPVSGRYYNGQSSEWTEDLYGYSSNTLRLVVYSGIVEIKTTDTGFTFNCYTYEVKSRF